MEEKEETRKIQFTGKSSYIVSLPKEWIVDLGLKQGDQVRVSRNGLSTLQIYPVNYKAQNIQTEEATIMIDVDEDISSTVRKLISLYFLGFKTINVKPKNGRLKPAQRTAVKTAGKRMLMGSEIISDSSDGITIQVLVNLLELSVDGAFKRMIHLAKSMLLDSILAVKEVNLDLAQEVINTDDEVDRFGFYIIRQLKIAIQNEHMLKEMGFKNARNCLGYRLVVKNIERTGDHAAFVAEDLLEFKKGIKKEILAKIQEMSNFAINVLDEACLSLFKEDYLQAEQTIQKTAEIVKYEKKVLDSSKSLRDDEELFRIRRMVENIKRIAEYASDIAEVVLNSNIEKALKK
ncbi:PhoU family transcriptional regulator [Nitrosopumilus sp. b1]|uniref:phosphate uptake regulator PhoU n=1 Tax=Nitrosopumilus sp. b1 TaxID=2109907 RepID=UPI000E2AD42E|nr:phosphate uptake regulator PhoU [Nitrosopumilus sp. b1]RDJ31802.1 MAG: phosphate uptake regulator PhoU [Thermoproteota archaeon]KAF6242107.1 PhoU family transcriptional regulator [Nitrosopumilus sp. b1]RDJ34632.1 MAG: phosphate uptake regulator PhoU [Thermoproteota archaeon]RDJ34701.1 MAG: phosphate uptake regulator PhoU [Thermoproteota archaeon]RDJ38424.1 MAG: phosphate uptake regulator PhoU [Thermoproteota archaeon]